MGDSDSTPELGRSPGEGHGYQLQYPGLENPMDCVVRGVANSRTQLSLSLSVMSSFKVIVNCLLNYLLKGPIFKYSHIGG